MKPKNDVITKKFTHNVSGQNYINNSNALEFKKGEKIKHHNQ